MKETVRTSLLLDCKSLFDHLMAPSLAAGSDKENVLDVLILKDLVRRAGTDPRWVPGSRQLADGLTKERAEALDALRAALRNSLFNIGDEERALEMRAQERARRLQRGAERARANGDLRREVPSSQ